jgi:hypothetical protein
MVEGRRAGNSTRTNQTALLVLVVQDIKAKACSTRSIRPTTALRSQCLNVKTEMGNFHVSEILETSKGCQY